MTADEAFDFFKKQYAHDLDTPEEIADHVEAYLTIDSDPPHSAFWRKRYVCLSHDTHQYWRVCFKTPIISCRTGNVTAAVQQVPVTSYPKLRSPHDEGEERDWSLHEDVHED